MDELLLPLFDHMRRRDVPLGISEYMGVVELLKAGDGLQNAEEMRTLCRMLWAKSREDQIELDRAFDQLVLPRLRLRYYPIMEDEAEEAKGLNKSSPVLGLTGQKADERDQQKTRSKEKMQTEIEQQPIEVSRGHPAFTESASMTGDWQFNFDFKDLPVFRLQPYLPVKSRALSYHLRHLRRWQRAGESHEINVNQTVEAISRQGFFVRPVFQNAYQNQWQILQLIDIAESLAPFELMLQEWQNAWELADLEGIVKTWYFHRYPRRVFYERPDQQGEKLIEAIIQRKPGMQGLIVLSDGGQRGTYEHDCFMAWSRIFPSIMESGYRMVWITPLPDDRWVGSTPDRLRLEFGLQMFCLSESGCRNAAQYLQGL